MLADTGLGECCILPTNQPSACSCLHHPVNASVAPLFEDGVPSSACLVLDTEADEEGTPPTKSGGPLRIYYVSSVCAGECVSGADEGWGKGARVYMY